MNDSYSLLDIINTFKTFLKYLFSKWWLLILTMIVGAGLGALYYFKQKPKYEGITTFILEEKTSNSSGLAGLASQFGFDLSSLGGSSNVFAGDNILDILKSKKVVQKVLLSRTDSTVKGSMTLGDLYLDFSNLKKSWEKKPSLYNVNFMNIDVPIDREQDSVLNIIYKAVLKKNLVADRVNKKGSIIRVKVTAKNSLFARLMANRLVEEASRMYLDIKMGTAQANINRLQRRSDSLLALLNTKSYATAASQPIDVNPGIKTAVVPMEIASRDKTVIGTVYAEIIKNLEASKMILSQQTPVIQVLDKPGLSIYDNKKTMSLLVAVGAIISLFLSVVLLLCKFLLFRTINNSSNKI